MQENRKSLLIMLADGIKIRGVAEEPMALGTSTTNQHRLQQMETTLLRALANLKSTGGNQGVFIWSCIWVRYSAKWMNAVLECGNTEWGVKYCMQLWCPRFNTDIEQRVQEKRWKNHERVGKKQFMRKGSGCSRDLRTESLCSHPRHSVKHRLDLEGSSVWQTVPRTGNWIRSIHSDIWCVLSIGRMIYHWNIFPVLWQMSHH